MTPKSGVAQSGGCTLRKIQGNVGQGPALRKALVAHLRGENFENDATNLKLLALITFGEGLHNDRHARPASPKLSAFRGEIDPAWPVIRLLEKLGLAKVLSKVDEGWENHRRRIPTTTVRPTGRVFVKD